MPITYVCLLRIKIRMFLKKKNVCTLKMNKVMNFLYNKYISYVIIFILLVFIMYNQLTSSTRIKILDERLKKLKLLPEVLLDCTTVVDHCFSPYKRYFEENYG